MPYDAPWGEGQPNTGPVPAGVGGTAPRPNIAGGVLRGRGPLVVSIGLLLVALLAVGGLVVLRSGSDESAPTAAVGEDAPTSATGDPEVGSELDTGDKVESGASDPNSTAAASSIECPHDLPQDLCELVSFVETDRGRPFKEFPGIDLQENDVFDTGLLALFDAESDELAVSGHVYRSLGIIAPDDDIVALIRSTLELGVVGYFDTDTGDLVVRGSEFDLYSKLVLVHELTHAHDDQWIGLDRPEYDDVDDESDFGLLAITEGNASRVEQHWRDSLSAGDQAKLNQLELSVLSPEDLEIYFQLPTFLLQVQISPYVDGLTLVNQIDAEGGEAAVDAAFENPPRTSEQVLHPEQYLSQDDVFLPPLPEADGDVIDDGVWGELGFRYWFSPRAGDGWGGDRYVTWLEGERACTRIEVYGDTEEDLVELFEEAEAWADQAPSRVAQITSDLVRITGCAG